MAKKKTGDWYLDHPNTKKAKEYFLAKAMENMDEETKQKVQKTLVLENKIKLYEQVDKIDIKINEYVEKNDDNVAKLLQIIKEVRYNKFPKVDCLTDDFVKNYKKQFDAILLLKDSLNDFRVSIFC